MHLIIQACFPFYCWCFFLPSNVNTTRVFTRIRRIADRLKRKLHKIQINGHFGVLYIDRRYPPTLPTLYFCIYICQRQHSNTRTSAPGLSFLITVLGRQIWKCPSKGGSSKGLFKSCRPWMKTLPRCHITGSCPVFTHNTTSVLLRF